MPEDAGGSLVLPSLAELRLTDFVDIAIVAGLLWLGITWFQNSRARLALIGLGAVGALFLVARGFELKLTTWLLQGFFAVAALMLIVVFQEDLRRLFERIAVWGLRRDAPRPSRGVQDELVRVCFRLAQDKVGALVVLPGKEPLTRHMEGGTPLDGRVSESLLFSLFDPSSPGHDGAVVVRGDRVERFGCHLPLSTDWDALSGGGTRHAAALGLAERCDALCLVVSEERGQVSMAFEGRLHTIERPETLKQALRGFLAQGRTPRAERGFLGALRRGSRRWREGMLAIGLAAGLWYVAIPGASVEAMTVPVVVRIHNLPEGYELMSVNPPEVQVRIEGRRRDLYLARANELSVDVDALLVQLGRRTFEVGADQVIHTDRVRVLGVSPTKVKLSIEKVGQSTK